MFKISLKISLSEIVLLFFLTEIFLSLQTKISDGILSSTETL